MIDAVTIELVRGRLLYAATKMGVALSSRPVFVILLSD